ncbi:MAG: 30S ribosomal protein S4 [Candidatus Bilamarchaeaceae archaeon]
MGDPRKIRNKYSRPKRLWDEDRIREDKELRKEYGLKNSSEVWKAADELRKFRREARRLLSLSEEEREADARKILAKLTRLGIMKKGGSLDDVLSLSVRDVLERRLQTMVYRKGLARTIIQSRQLITHGFIAVGSRRINIPGYIVPVDVEDAIRYAKPIDLSAGMISEREEKKEQTAEGDVSG